MYVIIFRDPQKGDFYYSRDMGGTIHLQEAWFFYSIEQALKAGCVGGEVFRIGFSSVAKVS